MIEHCRRADILIVAAGVPKYIQGDWIKEGCCVIDVGVNRIGKSEKTGKAILAGDVDFEQCSAEGLLHHPGSRRGRPHDHHHAHEKHRHGRQTGRGLGEDLKNILPAV